MCASNAFGLLTGFWAVFLVPVWRVPIAAPGPQRTPKDVFGEKGIGLLSDASRVQVFRVKSQKADDEAAPNFDGYPIIWTGKEQGEDFARKLAALLLDEDSFESLDRSLRNLELEPYISFRVWKGKESIDLLFSAWGFFLAQVKDERGGTIHKAKAVVNHSKFLSLKVIALAKESFRRKFLGDNGSTVFSKASRVEVFRIAPDQDRSRAETIDGFPITANGKDQGREFLSQLASVLLDKRTYSQQGHKECDFNPGVAFRIPLGEDLVVEVILCFHCDEFSLNIRHTNGSAIYTQHENFDPVRPTLVKLAKEAFPDDREIQALKERGR